MIAMKKILEAIGVGLIIGVSAYFLLNNKKNKGQKVNADFKEAKSEKISDENISMVYAKVAPNDETGYEDMKSSAIENMFFRHESTASIIKESIDTIRENIKISEDTNNNIDYVSAELDKMLSED